MLGCLWVKASQIRLPLLRFVLFLGPVLIGFPRCNQTVPACMGEGGRGGDGVLLLPLSVGLSVLVIWMSVGNMVCLRNDEAASICQNTPGIFSISRPCQNESSLSGFHHLMWQDLHAVHASVGSSLSLSPHLKLQLSVPVLWILFQSVVSQNHGAVDYFCTSTLHYRRFNWFIVIFNRDTCGKCSLETRRKV